MRLDLGLAAGGSVQAVQLAHLHVAPEALQGDVSGEVGRRAGQDPSRGDRPQDLETAEERGLGFELGRLEIAGGGQISAAIPTVTGLKCE
jgi:hypothetical protein